MLSQLLDELRSTPPLERAAESMAELLRRAALAGGEPLSRRLTSLPERYSRTCLFLDDRFEVVLLHWLPGAITMPHDHGGRHCWFAVAEGSLRVDNFTRVDDFSTPGRARLRAAGTTFLARGDLDIRNLPTDVHRVAATGVPAVSIHVYAEPLGEYLLFDEVAGTSTPARSSYDANLSRPEALAAFLAG